VGDLALYKAVENDIPSPMKVTVSRQGAGKGKFDTIVAFAFGLALWAPTQLKYKERRIY
jgi:hypothetical protein